MTCEQPGVELLLVKRHVVSIRRAHRLFAVRPRCSWSRLSLRHSRLRRWPIPEPSRWMMASRSRMSSCSPTAPRRSAAGLPTKKDADIRAHNARRNSVRDLGWRNRHPAGEATPGVPQLVALVTAGRPSSHMARSSRIAAETSSVSRTTACECRRTLASESRSALTRRQGTTSPTSRFQESRRARSPSVL